MDDLDQLREELADLGQNIEDVVNVTLPQLARQLGTEVTTDIFRVKQSRTGALRSSIRAGVSGNNLSFEMLDYGYFQSFGVNPVGGTSFNVFGLPDGVADSFGKLPGNTFSFKKQKMKNHPGISGIKSVAQLLENIDDIIINSIL